MPGRGGGEGRCGTLVDARLSHIMSFVYLYVYMSMALQASDNVPVGGKRV